MSSISWVLLGAGDISMNKTEKDSCSQSILSPSGENPQVQTEKPVCSHPKAKTSCKLLGKDIDYSPILRDCGERALTFIKCFLCARHLIIKVIIKKIWALTTYWAHRKVKSDTLHISFESSQQLFYLNCSAEKTGLEVKVICSSTLCLRSLHLSLILLSAGGHTHPCSVPLPVGGVSPPSPLSTSILPVLQSSA